MTSLLALTDKAIFDALKGNGQLITFLGGTAIYEGQAPHGTPTPYVIFFHVAGGDDNDHQVRTFDVDYQVEVIADSKAAAQLGAGYIDDTLHHGALNIAGWAVYWSASKRLLRKTENEEGRQFYRQGADFNIRASQ